MQAAGLLQNDNTMAKKTVTKTDSGGVKTKTVTKQYPDGMTSRSTVKSGNASGGTTKEKTRMSTYSSAIGEYSKYSQKKKSTGSNGMKYKSKSTNVSNSTYEGNATYGREKSKLSFPGAGTIKKESETYHNASGSSGSNSKTVNTKGLSRKTTKKSSYTSAPKTVQRSVVSKGV